MADQTTNANDPVWFKFVPRPDLMSIVTVFLLVLTWHVFDLIANNPALATNEIFKTTVILVIGTGGLGLAISFIYGGSKAGVAAADTVNAMARGSQLNGGGPAGGTVTTPPTGGTLTTTTTTTPAPPTSQAVTDALAKIATFTTRANFASWLGDGTLFDGMAAADRNVVIAAVQTQWETLPADGTMLVVFPPSGASNG